MSQSKPTPDSLLSLQFPSDPQISPDGRQVAYVISRIEEEKPHDVDKDFAKPRYKSRIWLSDGTTTRQLTYGEGRDSTPRWSPDGTQLAFVRQHGDIKSQLFILPLAGGEARQLTRFKNGIGGVQWSPDGRYLSFTSAADDEDKRDERGEARVITRPVYRFNGADWLPERAERLWRYDLQTDELTEWHAPAVDIGDYAWWPDSRGILFVSSADELAEAHWENEVYELLLDGQPRQLSDWKSSIGYVIPHPDNKQWAITGRPAGTLNHHDNHLYLMNGQQWQRLDDGWDYPVGEIVGADCHVGAFPARPVWRSDGSLLSLYTVGGSCGLFSVKDGQVKAVDHQPDGLISTFTAAGGQVALIRERADRFPEVELAGHQITHLHDLFPFPVQTPVRVTFDTPLGESEGWVLLPEGSGKVPALLNIHGGPHTAYGHGFTHEFQLFAAQGYGVCYGNPRGSVGYGQAFASDIYGRWGSVDYDDLMNFFDACLATQPRLDRQNAAVMGGSYGGFMTNWVIGHTNRFKAAITDRSICNLLSFNGTSDIGISFWPHELGLSFHRRADALKLWQMSPLAHAEDVKTPTLIVHSVLDHRCPIEQAEQWYAALRMNGVPTRFVRFPGETHELSRSGRPDRRLKRLEEYLGWLEQYL